MTGNEINLKLSTTQLVLSVIFLSTMISTQGVIMWRIKDIPPRWFLERVDKLEARINRECL